MNPNSGSGVFGMSSQMSNPMNTNAVQNSNGVTSNLRFFIQRDYRLGVNIRFTVEFPPELNGWIDQSAYEYTLNHINEMFEEAEAFNCSTFSESMIGFITANMIYFCKDTRYERCLKQVSRFVSEQNQRVYIPRGLQITDPVDRGLRCIEISVVSDQSRS